MRSSRVAAVIAATLLLLPLAACTGEDEPGADPPPAEPTPLADFETEGLTVAREPFCARVAPEAVEDALGAEAEDAEEWVNGDRVEVGGITDVVHEYGCRWRAADGTTASGWVLAPPITRSRAVALRRATAGADGCRALAGAPAYGSPSVAVRCKGRGRPVTTGFHGLFGDAWLSCSVTTAQVGAAGRWCVSVAEAASGS